MGSSSFRSRASSQGSGPGVRNVDGPYGLGSEGSVGSPETHHESGVIREFRALRRSAGQQIAASEFLRKYRLIEFRASRWRVMENPNPVERSEEHTSELQSLRHLVCRL